MEETKQKNRIFCGWMSHRSQHECFTGSQDLQDRPRLSSRRALRQMSCRFKQNTLYWNSYLEDDIPRLYVILETVIDYLQLWLFRLNLWADHVTCSDAVLSSVWAILACQAEMCLTHDAWPLFNSYKGGSKYCASPPKKLHNDRFTLV